MSIDTAMDMTGHGPVGSGGRLGTSPGEMGFGAERAIRAYVDQSIQGSDTAELGGTSRAPTGKLRTKDYPTLEVALAAPLLPPVSGGDAGDSSKDPDEPGHL